MTLSGDPGGRHATLEVTSATPTRGVTRAAGARSGRVVLVPVFARLVPVLVLSHLVRLLIFTGFLIKAALPEPITFAAQCRGYPTGS